MIIASTGTRSNREGIWNRRGLFYQLRKSVFETLAFTCTFNDLNQPIGPIGRVFANGPGNQGLIPGRVIPKTKKNGT